jgi:hypothetical protein
MIATEIRPFLDPVMLKLFDELERAMYGHLPVREGERSNNVVEIPVVAPQ